MNFERHIRKVLIIDDDPIFAEILEAFFVKRGTATVLRATNGEEAKSMLKEHSADLDLITSDLNMPGVDGVEFLMHLNTKHEVKIPIVILSAAAKSVVDASSKLAVAYGLRFLGSLSKPIVATRLEELLMPILPDSKE